MLHFIDPAFSARNWRFAAGFVLYQWEGDFHLLKELH